jgi:hypothetical protein
MDVRRRFWLWTTEWGPTSGWQKRVAIDYKVAEADGSLEEWKMKICGMANTGRWMSDVLRTLSFLEFPKDKAEFQDLLRQAFDLMRDVLQGVYMLEARLKESGPFFYV